MITDNDNHHKIPNCSKWSITICGNDDDDDDDDGKITLLLLFVLLLLLLLLVYTFEKSMSLMIDWNLDAKEPYVNDYVM